MKIRSVTAGLIVLAAGGAIFATYAVTQDRPQGAILPGSEVRSQIVEGEPVPDLKADKPDTYVFHEQSDFLNLDGIPDERLVYATHADAIFNDDDAAYRISFHYSHFGGMPIDAGDFNGDGIDDFMVTDHFAWVDGNDRTGEVQLYFGRRDGIDPRKQVPDVIFYGEEIWGKLGITIAGNGDFNGDGRDDLAFGAAYTTTRLPDGTAVKNAGKVYIVYGGTLDLSKPTVKVRMGDIGESVPGIVFEGGHDGSLQIAYSNGIEFGDFNGDGVDDLLIGSYNPYNYNDKGDALDWPAKAWLVYGQKGEPLTIRSHPLGVDRDTLPIHEIIVPERDWTRQSLGWSTNFVGDLNGDGFDEIAFGTYAGGSGERGAVYFFRGGNDALPPGGVTSVTESDFVIDATEKTAEVENGRSLSFASLLSARPAGDIDGDGFPDVLITSRLAALGNTNVGAVGVFKGGESLASTDYADLPHIFYGANPGRMGQPAMDVGADFDGDGYADVLINDAYYKDWLDPGKVQARGRLWLIRGSADLPKFIPIEENADLTFVADTRGPGLFGYTWTTGDWNGDGKPDIVIGDHYAGDKLGNVHAGKVYMYFNGSSFSLD